MKLSAKIIAGMTLLMPAVGMSNPSSPFNGFYVGANLGLITSDVNIQHTVASNTGAVPTIPPPNVFQIQFADGDPNRFTDTACLGALKLGYSQLFRPNWLLGIEGRVSLNYLSSPDWHAIYNNPDQLLNKETTVELKQQYALLGRIGFLLADNIQGYGLIGPQWGQFRIHSNSSLHDNENNGQLLFDSSNSSEQSGYNCGLLLGLGIEYWLGCNFTLGLEYNYTSYGNLDYPDSVTSQVTLEGFGVLPNSAYTDYHQIYMNTNAFLLKIAYYFSL